MHEYSIAAGVMDTVIPLARKAGATRIACVRLRIGVMTEVVQESLDFMWDVLCDERGPITKGTKLEVQYVQPRSVCIACGAEFEHDRFHVRCPKCGSAETMLQQGRELEIINFDVDTPDDIDEAPASSVADEPEGAPTDGLDGGPASGAEAGEYVPKSPEGCSAGVPAAGDGASPEGVPVGKEG